MFAYVVTLNPPPTSVEDGKSVVFTGTVVIPCESYLSICHPEPAHDVTVQIIDQVSDIEIATDVTDIDGKFLAQWEAEYRGNNYLIFSVAYTVDDTPHTSQNYSLYVYQRPIETKIQLILEPLTPSTQVTLGQTVTFSGRLVADDKFDKRIKLVVDGIAIAVKRTDQKGQFAIPWTPQSEDVGGHQIYVLYDDEHFEVKSESYGVEVLSSIPYTVKIITDSTNGIVSFWAHFEAEVSGGKGPHNFLWNIDGEARTEQSFDKQFVTVGDYPVTLTVTDSQSQTRIAQVTIFAKNPPPTTPPLNPQIIINQNNVKEGDKVSFVAEVKDPNRVKSYEWRIDYGNLISSSKEASFVFADDGSYLISLSVVDINGKRHSATKSISVLNAPPKITSSLQNYEIEDGKALPLNVLFTDPGIEDNFTIEFFVGEQKLDVRHQNSPELATFSFNLNPGRYNAKVIVTDNDGEKDERNFSIVIREPRFPIEVVTGTIIAAGAGGGYGIKKYLDTRNGQQGHADLRIEIRVLRSGIER
ncbi:MAG: repeat protein [Candidatus Nitrosotenuis sp.]|nr:repeat protein [Candidatus Nitrosotenuis sp.]